MFSLYSDAMDLGGWSDKRKRREMKEDVPKYLVVYQGDEVNLQNLSDIKNTLVMTLFATNRIEYCRV